MENKRVLVLMSTFNGERYLDMQLESIFSQKTNADISLVVRDDGSNDSTLDILARWAERVPIDIMESGRNVGPAASFWELLTDANDADYYALSDQDDIWDNNKIQTALDEIGNDSSPVLWTSNCRIIDENSVIVKNQLSITPPILTVITQVICGSAQGCSMVLNRAAVETIRAYNPSCDPMHDLVIMEYMLVIGKVIYHRFPVFSYRIHQNNVIAKQDVSFLSRVLNFKRWLKDRKYSYSNLAAEMLKDLSDLMDAETISYLTDLTRCRYSCKARLSILFNKKTQNQNKRALRSYRIRVGLGII